MRKFPKYPERIGNHIGVPKFRELLRRFLYDQIHPNASLSGDDVDISDCPNFNEPIAVFPSAYAHYYAPSDVCGAQGMVRQVIHSTRGWKNVAARYDCVLVDTDDPTVPGLAGMYVGQVLLFFSFKFRGCDYYPCALVKWFKIIGEKPCHITGMWMVEPEFDDDQRVMSIIHVGSIIRSAHLIPIYGKHDVDSELHYSYSLDAFRAFYVSPYSDYHMYFNYSIAPAT